MKTNAPEHEILIVGAGTMGASLAQNYAQNGFTVGLLDLSDEIIAKARETIARELNAAKGRIFTQADIDAIQGRIFGTSSYEEACASKRIRLVVEAATENIEIKKKIFAQLDRLAPPEAIIATNSSSLDANILAAATKRPEKVVWMHYFYLPHKNRAGEYAGTDTATPSTLKAAKDFMTLGGKIPTWIRGSRKGGVADIIFVSLLLEATRMLEEGFRMSTIEEAGKRAYNIPVGFFELMDNTGIPVGLYAMRSFSDASDPNDPLHKVYGNFFAPRQNYIDLVARLNAAAPGAEPVVWYTREEQAQPPEGEEAIRALTERFHAIGFLTAAETVDAGLITIEDLELLTQNAFLWRDGPFTLMKRLGSAYVRNAVEARAALAKKQKQDFPLCATLRNYMTGGADWNFTIRRVQTENEMAGKVRWITLCHPKAANAMDNAVFDEWAEEFGRANEDPECRAIVVDTAPIKTFIAGADIQTFLSHIRAGEVDAIVADTRRWQKVLFTIMTGTPKPKIAIVDGKALGGGVEVASAFAHDPNSAVIMTTRTGFTLPETKLGIYPGLRGTILLPQIIFRKTGDLDLALAYSRYLILSGSPSSSARVLRHLGFADELVEPHRRMAAVRPYVEFVLAQGKLPDATERKSFPIDRACAALTHEERQELQVIRDLFLVDDLIPSFYAIAKGDREAALSGWRKGFAQSVARRVMNNSPFAVARADWLVNAACDMHLHGAGNDAIAAYELDHHLGEVFRHPDALAGLEAVMRGAFPSFQRRYPFRGVRLPEPALA